MTSAHIHEAVEENTTQMADFCPGSGTTDYTNVTYYPLGDSKLVYVYCAGCGRSLAAEEEFVSSSTVIENGLKTLTLQHRLSVPFHNKS